MELQEEACIEFVHAISPCSRYIFLTSQTASARDWQHTSCDKAHKQSCAALPAGSMLSL